MTTGEKLAAVAAAAGGAYALYRYGEILTGSPTLDRFAMRARALAWSLRLGVPAEVIMASLHQESEGDPAQYLGDTTNAHGPSVGPLQMSRATAIARGLVPSTITREEFARYAAPEHEGSTFEWGARYLAELYHRHSGDAWAAWAAYNGSQSYALAAAVWLTNTFPAFARSALRDS